MNNQENEDPALFQKKADQGFEEVLNQFDPAKFLVVLKRSVLWMLLLLIIGVSGAYFFVRYTKPVYEASSVIKLDQKNEAGILGFNAGDKSSSNYSRLSGELEILKSRMIFEDVIDTLPMDVSCYTKGEILEEEHYRNQPFIVHYDIADESWRDKKLFVSVKNGEEYLLKYNKDVGDEVTRVGAFGKEISLPGLDLRLEKTGTLPRFYQEDMYFVINSRESLISYIQSNISLNIENLDASTIRISFNDHNQAKAQEIVKTLGDIYLKRTIEDKSKTQEQTLKFLEKSLKSTEKKLAQSENELENFIRSNKTIDVQNKFTRVSDKILTLKEQRETFRLELDMLNKLQDAVLEDKQFKSGDAAIIASTNASLGQLLEKLAALKQERAMMLTTTKENTHVIRQKDLAIENLRNTILNSIDQQRDMLYDQVKEVSEKLQTVESDFLALPSKETEYTRIKRFYNLYEKFYLLLMEKEVEYGIAKAGLVPNFVVLSEARVNSSPVYPNVLMVYGTGIFSGLFLGVLLVVVRYMFYDTIATQKELERSLAAPVIGGIPVYNRKKLENSRLVIEGNSKSALSEALRSIRTNLEFISPGKEKKSISLTSTVSGEGKTFVTVNLGAVISLSGKKVVIVDLDLRKPKVHMAMDAVNDKGASNILIGKAGVEECIQNSSLPNLDFITAGATPPNPSELILRPELDNLINTLHKTYDVILIDSPPVGLVTDGILVMRKVDVPLFVVRANFSKKKVKSNINHLVEQVGFRNLSVVMNAVGPGTNYGYTGYGYGYGYGYYEGDDREKGLKGRLKGIFSVS